MSVPGESRPAPTRPPLRFGVVILPDERWGTARRRWEKAEALGFDHAWTYDHLTWRSFRDRPWFGALPTLGAAAAATRRILLGPLVASPNFRHPVPLAKELMTLDDLSGGRLIAGLGAGGSGFDASALGGDPWSRGERARRFEEFTRLLDRLLREPAVDSTGRYYSASQARAIPGCLHAPRLAFAIAATGPRGMQLAAQLADLWVITDGIPLERAIVERFEDACAKVGREPATVRRLVLLGFTNDPLASANAFVDAAGRCAELGFTDIVVHWPRRDDPFRGQEEVLEAAAERLLASPRYDFR